MPLLKENTAAPARVVVDYGRKLEAAIQTIEADIAAYPAIQQQYPARWLAIKLLEQDRDLQTRLLSIQGGPALLTKAQLAYARLAGDYGEEIDVLIADRRYTYIHELVGRVMHKPPETLSLTDRIDRLVTHRLLGVPIFMAVMWVVFKLTAVVSAPLLDWVDGVISGPVTHWATIVMGWVGLGGSWVEALLVDGVITGVGGVLVFVPVLMFLYVSLAVLEDTGYMARAAFVMDGLMNRIGLQGKSFLPMMVGFGCTVPAIYATRTLENEKDRILTGLLVPFMSCGARLPVYVLFATVFFSAYAGAVVFSMYVLGIVTAVLLGLILRKTLFKDKEQTALLMELPPYRRPNWRTIWLHTWERTRSFIQNAWSLILITSVVLWLLMAIPVGADGGSFANTDVDHSLFSSVAGAISPALEPLGFGTWEASGALISGFVAKEVVVSTFAQVYGLQDSGAAAAPTTFGQDVVEIVRGFGTAVLDTVKAIPLIVGLDVRGESSETIPGGLRQAVYEGFNASSGGHAALAGLAFMVFVLIYTPCMVAAAAERHELGAKWMWRSVIGQLVLAWLMALAVFQGGLLLGLG
ncbi:MAG: ferrous iron transport protein B [Chloroflexi bacterium]|nr:ferrous iron transport protein B [Chloroflexota bacterium]MBP7041428.1 ferrous iron transport protein B [Chloroflexota bacterium]